MRCAFGLLSSQVMSFDNSENLLLNSKCNWWSRPKLKNAFIPENNADSIIPRLYGRLWHGTIWLTPPSMIGMIIAGKAVIPNFNLFRLPATPCFTPRLRQSSHHLYRTVSSLFSQRSYFRSWSSSDDVGVISLTSISISWLIIFKFLYTQTNIFFQH